MTEKMSKMQQVIDHIEDDIYEEDDGWTIRTEDGKSAAHYEHTVLITKDGYEILTPRLD